MEALKAPWLKYYGNTPSSIDYPEKTMYEMIEDSARRYPGNIAYEFMARRPITAPSLPAYRPRPRRCGPLASARATA